MAARRSVISVTFPTTSCARCILPTGAGFMREAPGQGDEVVLREARPHAGVDR